MSFENITTGSPILDTIIAAVAFAVSSYLLYVAKKKIFDKKTKFDDSKTERPKPSQLENNLKNIRKFVRIINPQPILHNKEFSCGCWAKDTIMVKLCKLHKRQHLGMNYHPPEGYYISEDHSLI